MKSFTNWLIAILLLIVPFSSLAQRPNDIVKWNFETKKINDYTFDIIGRATITQSNFHIWALNPGGKDGSLGISLIPTTIKLDKNPNLKLLGGVKVQGKKITKKDEDFGTIHYYENNAVYTQRVEAKANTTIRGIATFQTCNENGCLPPTDVPFELKLTGVVPKIDSTKIKDSLALLASNNTPDSIVEMNDSLALAQSNDTTVKDSISTVSTLPISPEINTNSDGDGLEKKSLWELFIMGLLAGFVAFIMPCIYAMLPVTVSFFTKRSKDRATGIRNAIFYAFSIILIFVLIGGLISVAFTEKTMYEISSSIWFNLFVFAIFVIFGISLLGAFEITLPSSWSNALDKKANSSNFGGIFFMALVLVVVSFSCTSAFISMLIVYIMKSGNSLGGIFGFLGFGLAIALPFALGALFPGMINKMAKSGGWLNAIKVTMGFAELALALKFLSNVDLAYHWGLLDVEVFLAIWIVLAVLLGLYLLGKLKFSHDEELPKNHFGVPYIGVPRLFFAIASFSFAVYMVPGLFGAPLEAISGFLPESKTHDFNLNKKLIEIQTMGAIGEGNDNSNTTKPTKYTQNLKSELPSIDAFFDYEEALAAGKKEGKPVLLDFTGHSCINCRKMERAVLSKPEVLKMLKKDFIVASLYVDDSTPLLPEDQYTSKHDGKLMKTLGDKNLDIQLMRFNSVMQPLYIFVDGDGNIIENAGGYDKDINRFINILNNVKSKHQASK